MLSIKKTTPQTPFINIIVHCLIVLFIVLATRAYLGYFTVQQIITLNQHKKEMIEKEIVFLREYRLPYLESDQAVYFSNHENGMPHPGEQLVRIKKYSEQIKPDISIVSPNGDRKKPSTLLTGGRKSYLQYKFQKIP